MRPSTSPPCRLAQDSRRTLLVKAKTVFPDDSKTGDTDALPAAFEKKADLFARFDKNGRRLPNGAHAAIKDEASFKAEWPKVAANCGGCHKEYRKPK
jgi:cytochrome c556